MQHNKFLVMDSGGFIRGFHHLDQFYSEYHMSTVQEVIYEIRDRKTRNKLDSGVFEVHLSSPHPDALQRTIDFCKATGDYAALSAVDIKVIALAVSMEMEKNGTKYLKEIPPTPKFEQARPISDCLKKQENPLESLALPTKKTTQNSNTTSTNTKNDLETVETGETAETDNVSDQDPEIAVDQEGECKEIVGEGENGQEENDQEGNDLEGNDEDENGQEENDQEGNDQENDDDQPWDDNDDGGWITPDNFSQIMLHADKPDDEEDRIFVACCTTDFAMQNVLLQMGIKLLSIDGLQIRNVRNWTLRCFACMRISPDRDRVFCKFCGNKTLRKISIFIDESGEVKYVNPRRQISTRGTKFSIPKPKPGRANRPNGQFIVSEHQYNQYNKGGQKKRDLDAMMDSEFDFSRKKQAGKVNPGLAKGNPNKVKRTTAKNKRNRRRR